MKEGQDNISEIKQPYQIVQRISQEEIICQAQKSEQLLQSVVCPVCLMLLPMPHYTCDVCDNAFCPDCLQNWWIKHEKMCIFKCQNPNFKVVKRSNTYNALMEILKTKCRHCSSCVSIVQLQAHDKICPKKPVICSIQGCGANLIRSQIEDHQSKCEYKRFNCQYCSQSIYKKDFDSHINILCQSREIICENKDCGALIKLKDQNDHKNSCYFKVQQCQWCKQAMLRKDKISHQNNCTQKIQKCGWCQQTLKTLDFKRHQQTCIQRPIICDLCDAKISIELFKDHKFQCMFANLVQIKKYQNQLIHENSKLKQKICQLQNSILDIVKKQDEGPFNVLMKIKEEERREFQKDLLRLNNGIANIQKLRNAQLTQHLKKPHLSSSLCPFCNHIRNKLEQDLAPLLKQKEQINRKVMQVERMYQATAKSKLRMSKIRI